MSKLKRLAKDIIERKWTYISAAAIGVAVGTALHFSYAPGLLEEQKQNITAGPREDTYIEINNKRYFSEIDRISVEER